MSSESSSFPYWFFFGLQQLLIPLLSFAVTMPVMNLIGSHELSKSSFVVDLAEVATDVAPVVVAACLGSIAGSLSSSIRESARMIWMFPQLLLLQVNYNAANQPLQTTYSYQGVSFAETAAAVP